MDAKDHPDFPLGSWPNGQWAKKINKRPYYFGSVADDATGSRAIAEYKDRLPGILAGTDHLRHLEAGKGQWSVGDLMREYLAQRRLDVAGGSLAKPVFGDYIRELGLFAAWIKPTTAVAALKPEHFAGYVAELQEKRKLKANARKRVQALIKAMFRWGSGNGKTPAINFGSAFKSPATTEDALRKEKARAGLIDYSERILTGEEIDKLLAESQPNMRAMILLGVNCGLGPADIGRLQWRHLDLTNRRIDYPRHKTGAPRRGYLWKRTVDALNDLLHPAHGHPLKRTKIEYDKHGQNALVFVTRTGKPYYHEKEVVEDGKVVGVQVSSPIPNTFGRMARDLGLLGVTFYRLRHTMSTLAQYARDSKAVDLMMGHRIGSVKKRYDHSKITWKRLKRVALKVKARLWPKPKLEGGTNGQTMRIAGGDGGVEAAAA